ncbi:hypothetical protein HPB52_024374 [Rhipicephalus sanguineus]|uniref:Uncharacterized protein n=1 Tax=Rhipicephalus sanguineus TaxID=34632 RepID=A0A9D4TCJ1_RHISA|nr:hypothetical protein HPB52_024374 [Rhipicephalus sanguineus]
MGPGRRGPPLQRASGGQPSREPILQVCGYLGSTWHVLYRTVKHGAFGEDDRCLRDTQLTEVVDGKARFRFRFGDGHERNATFRFELRDGRNYDAFRARVDGAKGVMKCSVLYVECDQCKIIKCPGSEYIDLL